MKSKDIFHTIVAQIKECVPELIEQNIEIQHSMSDLGINSMERAEVLIATLEAIDLTVPMTALHGPKNLGELAELLHEKKSQA